MSSNAARLYKHIKGNPDLTQSLFRQALQDPQGALEAICQLGQTLDLPVSHDEVQVFLRSLDDDETKQWVVKARGGL